MACSLRPRVGAAGFPAGPLYSVELSREKALVSEQIGTGLA